jgi:LmbE family N-acetylglucosaminyl deacetylase
MMNWEKTLVIAVHPDDETLGCGGTLLKLKKLNKEIHWLIVTSTKNSKIFGEAFGLKREEEIKKAAAAYRFNSYETLEFEAGFLEEAPKINIVNAISKVIKEIQPDTLFLPFPWDIHKEHQVTFEAAIACTKVFRNNFIKRVFVMETLSETDFAPVPLVNSFIPTHFVDVTGFIEKKIEIMKIFGSEMLPHPFPRSEENVRALSKMRGAQSGFYEAESFMCLKERYL